MICLQEVQIESHSGKSQVEQLQDALPQYKYSSFTTIYLKDSQRGVEQNPPLQHGMAVLSKHPIMKMVEWYPTLSEDEIEPRCIQNFEVSVDDKLYKLANVHLGNRTKWATKQLTQYLEWLSTRGEQRIMAGDFNLPILPQFKNLESIVSSNQELDYISYPPQEWCLDYILLPNEYSFDLLECAQTDISDHNPVIAKINLAD